MMLGCREPDSRAGSISSPAAVVSGIPWSWAEGMKWVAISPLVDAPQMANPTASAQKVRVLAAMARVITARRAGPTVPGSVAPGWGAPEGTSVGAP